MPSGYSAISPRSGGSLASTSHSGHLERGDPAFLDFQPEHWLHLRTANVIESPFVTVHLRQRVAKGAVSRQKGLLMAHPGRPDRCGATRD